MDIAMLHLRIWHEEQSRPLSLILRGRLKRSFLWMKEARQRASCLLPGFLCFLPVPDFLCRVIRRS